METIIGGIIGAVATVIAAAIMARPEMIGNIFGKHKIGNIKGTYRSYWKDMDEKDAPMEEERLVIERQNGLKISGYIEMDEEQERDKKWDFEGRFTGKFLQIMYYPSLKAENKMFVDYGCYFFELQGDGKLFKGYSAGVAWDKTESLHTSIHWLEKIR